MVNANPARIRNKGYSAQGALDQVVEAIGVTTPCRLLALGIVNNGAAAAACVLELRDQNVLKATTNGPIVHTTGYPVNAAVGVGSAWQERFEGMLFRNGINIFQSGAAAVADYAVNITYELL